MDFGLYIKATKSYNTYISYNGMQSTISTHDVARMLGVTETTVKRWSDEGLLRCVRTPGGHRKFLLSDLAAFAKVHGLTAAGLQPPPMTKAQFEELALGISLREYKRIAAVLLEELVQADREGVFELLTYLVTNGAPLSVVADDVIRPAFQRIGELWEQGKFGINQEHAATYTMQEALSRLVPTLHRKPVKALGVLSACPPNELHDLGLRCLSYCLELEGWQTRYLGANTPTESLLQQVDELKPQLVALSVTAPRPKRYLIQQLNAIAKEIRARRAVLILGGFASSCLTYDDIACDFIGTGVQDTLRFVGERFGLRPGRKRRADVKA